MKRGLLILLLIPLYLILTSKSCDSDGESNARLEKDKTRQTREKIREEFEAEYLTDQTLRAFEWKARQKLMDFADYLNIYHNRKLDKTLKDQAGQMIAGLFASEQVAICSFFPGHQGSREARLPEFLNTDFLPGYHSVNVLIDSVRIETPLYRKNDTRYEGQLSFIRRLKAISPRDTLSVSGTRMKVNITAAKVNKTFGTDTLHVWAVFLGDIR